MSLKAISIRSHHDSNCQRQRQRVKSSYFYFNCSLLYCQNYRLFYFYILYRLSRAPQTDGLVNEPRLRLKINTLRMIVSKMRRTFHSQHRRYWVNGKHLSNAHVNKRSRLTACMRYCSFQLDSMHGLRLCWVWHLVKSEFMSNNIHHDAVAHVLAAQSICRWNAWRIWFLFFSSQNKQINQF